MSPFVEEEFARALAEKGILQNTAWLTPGDTLEKSGPLQPQILITTTSSNDIIRFFEAGRWIPGTHDYSRNICIRGKAPLIQCLKEIDNRGPMKSNQSTGAEGWVVIG